MTVNYGGEDGKTITCFYDDKDGEKKELVEGKLERYNRDVFYSVTKDEQKVYMKLVNADNFKKKLKVHLKELEVKGQADVITLTGEAELVHLANVNTKEKERIVPVQSEMSVQNNEFEIILPANSVNVVVLDKA